MVLALAALSSGACKKHPVATGPKPKLEIREVADDVHPFVIYRPLAPAVLRDESVGMPATTGKYAELSFAPGTDPRNAERDLRAALGVVPTGPDVRFAYGPVQDSEGAPAVRSYLVRISTILTERDVVGAKAVEDTDRGTWSVSVTLDPSAASRFESYTASHVGGRLAIVVDDVVQSAPVIRSKIGGGTLMITLGGSHEHDAAEAGRLAGGFGGAP